MNDEVKEMISKALRNEPPVGVSYETVLAAGRRRRTRRQAGIVGGAALGVAAVVSSVVLVGHRTTSEPVTPAGPATSAPAPAVSGGCAMPAYTGGFTDAPDGVASAEELAESARLTEAFAGFALPLPVGVTADPAKPALCAIKESWGTRITLRSPAGERALFIEVKAESWARAGTCPAPDRRASCSVRRLDDGSMFRLTEMPAAAPKQPVLVSAGVWRPDNTVVRVLETGAEAPAPAPRILDDKALLIIATAPALKLAWSGSPHPPEPSLQRAAELTDSLLRSPVLSNGVILPADGSQVSQGGYKLNFDLQDRAGVGNLFVNLNPPDPGASVDCAGQTGCEPITMPDGRKATLTRSSDGAIQRIMLSTVAADGTQVLVMTSNQSEKSLTQGKPVKTRPSPPLHAEDLIRIASFPWLHW